MANGNVATSDWLACFPNEHMVGSISEQGPKALVIQTYCGLGRGGDGGRASRTTRSPWM